ncbi:MAG: hypothetical protein GWO24_12125 [Akkermansiaceae bacterium]|nr:hypothetical protein [Akkermansiaceae bacterium]
MILTRQLGIGSAILLSLGVAREAPADQESAGRAAGEGSIDRIEWGRQWAGPELSGTKSLEGKVVLLKIWGG